MSTTLEIAYTNAVNAALKYSSGRVAQVTNYLGTALANLPKGVARGSVKMPIWSAMTAASIADGTIQTSALNNTEATITIDNAAAPISLLPKEVGSETFDAANMLVASRTCAESLRLAAWQGYIDALIAGSPTQSNTLTAGKANFNAATVTELQIWLNTLLTTAANRGGDTSEFVCIMHPTTFGYFSAAVAALWPNAGFVDAQNMYRVFQCPVVPIPHPTTSAWGQVSNSCAFFLHPEGAPLKIEDAVLHGGGMLAASDATYKWITTVVYGYCLAQAALTGEIKNDAS